MDIIKSIQESAMGWRMGFTSLFGGGLSPKPEPKTQIGESLIGAGYGAAVSRFAGIKAGTVVRQEPGAPAPVGVRYISVPGSGGDAGYDLRAPDPDQDPGTPATVVEAIQKSIGESVEGWRMGFAHLGTKLGGASADLKAGIEKSLAGWGLAAGIVGEKAKKGVGGIGEWFGNVGGGLSSIKWLLYIVVFALIFVAIMTSIGYSGVGGPAARVAEREHARVR